MKLRINKFDRKNVNIFTGCCDTKTAYNSSLMSEWAIEMMGKVDNIENNTDKPVQILIYLSNDLHNFVMGNFLRKEQHRVFLTVNCAVFAGILAFFFYQLADHVDAE